jgi:hypothetical protein
VKEEFEYYPHKISEDHWLIFKVNTYHYKEPSEIYQIKKWGGEMHCDCKAGHGCKHLLMIQPKKELF